MKDFWYQVWGGTQHEVGMEISSYVTRYDHVYLSGQLNSTDIRWNIAHLIEDQLKEGGIM